VNIPLLNAARVLSDTDTIFLVGRGAQLLEEKCTCDTSAMLVVRASEDEIAVVLRDQSYETTYINSPIETLIAGAVENVNSLKELLIAAGLKSTLLKVPYAFHSPQMDPILANLVQLAGGVKFAEPQISVVCPLDGTIVLEGGKFDP
jgi:acyl transferase domain-containing protein